MTPSKLVRTLLLAALTLAAVPLALPATSADHGLPHERCNDGSASSAAIGNIAASGVVLQTQVGSQTVELPRGLLALAVSTTGTLEVDIKHSCIRAYHFVATRTTLMGTTTPVDVWAYPGCVSGVDTYSLPVGMDLVDYSLHLDWFGCDGKAGSDHRDIKVVDP